MIVGLSGKKQSGKDTVALMWEFIECYGEPVGNNDCDRFVYLQEKFNVKHLTGSDWSEIHKDGAESFAEPLKNMVGSIACPLVGPKYYNAHLSLEVIKSSSSSIINLETGEPYTIRELLQKVGTEVCRVINPDIWINIMEQKIKFYLNTLYGYDLVITDVRFKNEAEMILKYSPVLIRINRDNVEKSDHISETDLDDFEFKYVIDNNGTFDELFEQVYSIYKQVHN